jgi:TIR domain-containing protein
MEKQRKTFLSYSRANKDFAIRLAKELKSEGFHVWLDQLDIPLGARWDVEVEKALEESEIFMIIMTPASIASENVRDEIGYAIDNGKRFLPVLLENCTVPLRLRRFQYVDFSNKNFDEGVEAAKELLRGLIAQPTVPRIDLPDDARKQMAQAEADRKAREEADRVAKQKADEELAAKAETERKAQKVADRYATQKAQDDRKAKEKLDNELAAKAASERRAKEEAKQIAAQKLEADRLAKQQVEQERISKARLEADRKATGVDAMPVVEMKAQPISASTTQKKPVSRGLVIGGVAVVAVLICAGIGFSLLSNLGTPAAEVSPTEVPSTNIDISTKTSILNPTATAIPSVQATRTKTTAPTQAALPDFFTIQFNKNTNLENFDYYEMGSGDDSKVDITQSDDGLTFLLNDQSLYVYYIYQPRSYENVVVRIRAENIGTLNNNNVSLVCRMTDHTWYEFSVTSGGLWYLYDASNDDYMEISNGGTTALKTGQNVNDYEMRCIGNNISLYINGQEVTTIKHDLYKEGQVGFNISSLNVYPIEVQVIEFEISEP